MKYPLAISVLTSLVITGLVMAVYDVATPEQCDVAVSYELPKVDSTSTARLATSTRNFSDKAGYTFMQAMLDGRLTIYGAKSDKDRLKIIFNVTKPKTIKVSFYDCRRGGNGSATGEAWMRAIGRHYLSSVPPNNSFKPKPLRGSA